MLNIVDCVDLNVDIIRSALIGIAGLENIKDPLSVGRLSLPDHADEVIMIHIEFMQDAGLLVISDWRNGNVILRRMTPKGYAFMAGIRDLETWERIKKSVNDEPVLEIMYELSQGLLRKAAKEWLDLE